MNEKNHIHTDNEKRGYTTPEADFIPLEMTENIAASGSDPSEQEKKAFKPFFSGITDEDNFGF